MRDEYLSRCVVDPIKRIIYIYSTEGNERRVVCESVDEFMNALAFVRSTVHEDILVYTNP